MAFWGAEVKSGVSCPVNVGKGKTLTLTQACLGKSNEKTDCYVRLQIKVDDKNIVIGTLHSNRLQVQVYNMFFDRDFEISHDWENGSVYFCGHKSEQTPDELSSPEDFGYEDREMELIPDEW